MTHRAGEHYSLIDLKLIPGAVASGPNQYSPFFPFKPEYIEQRTIDYFTTKRPATIPEKMYSMIDAVGFLDSLHDFKSDFYDCQAPIRADKSIFSFKKFGFSIITLFKLFIIEENL